MESCLLRKLYKHLAFLRTERFKKKAWQEVIHPVTNMQFEEQLFPNSSIISIIQVKYLKFFLPLPDDIIGRRNFESNTA